MNKISFGGIAQVISICSLLLLMPLPYLSSQEMTGDQQFPYTLGAGAELNQNTRKGFAFSYGAAVDRIIAYMNGDGVLLAGVRGFMITDFTSIKATEADVYIRLNTFKLGPGKFFGQLSWGYAGYQEESIDAQTMLMDFTLGYRAFLGGFYAEPYLRCGFPFRMAFGLLAGHRFSF